MSKLIFDYSKHGASAKGGRIAQGKLARPIGNAPKSWAYQERKARAMLRASAKRNGWRD